MTIFAEVILKPRRAGLACFFLLFGLLAGRAQTGPTNLLVKNGDKVAFLGDSITALGWGLSGGWVHLVATGLDAMGIKIVPIPAGVAGNRSVELLARFNTDVLSKKPDWLLINCGVNDAYFNTVTPAQFKTNITSMVDQAQSTGIKVMLLTTSPIDERPERTAAVVACMKEIAKEKNLPVADMNADWLSYINTQGPLTDTQVITADHIHPNTDGALVTARCVLKAMGATPDQMEKAEAAWLAAPDLASIWLRTNLNSVAQLTPAQFDALQKVADARKESRDMLISGVQLEALKEVLQAMKNRGELSTVTEAKVKSAAQPIFQKELQDLAK